MNVLGLDMSSQKSGYSVFRDGKLWKYGVWEMSSKDEPDWRKRIAYMSEQVQECCKKYGIREIYAEDVPPILENTQTVKVLSALQGMLIATSVLYDIDIHFIPVKTWKSKIGIDLDASKENHALKKNIKARFGANAKPKLSTVKGWVRGWEKKMSVDYANDLFGIELVYKSPTSKFNQDDIADSINVAWSQIGDVKPYALDTFEHITENFYELITQK
jgi:Holliday junction resolvasome RuvABC endonuclease subunit